MAGEQKIEVVDSYNYLGIKIESKLTFAPHLRTLLRNVSYENKQFWRIRRYLSQENAILIYKTMISPIFNYANLFLYSGTKNLLKKLQTQQNQAIRIILKVSKRTNIDTQHANFNVHTLSNERKISMLCQSYKKSLNICNRDSRVLRTHAHEPGRRQLIIERPLNNMYRKS